MQGRLGEKIETKAKANAVAVTQPGSTGKAE